MALPVYVNSGAYSRVAVSKDAVTGLPVTPPAITAGNLLILQFTHGGVSADFATHTINVTAPSAVWTKLYHDLSANNNRHCLYYKFATGAAESVVQVKFISAGTSGLSAIVNGVIHQFAGVAASIPVNEGEAVTSLSIANPSVVDITTVSPDRLVLNFVMKSQAVSFPGASTGPTGSGPSWTCNAYGVPSLSFPMCLWSTPAITPGTYGGPAVWGAPTLAGQTMIRGFALPSPAVPSIAQKLHHYIMMSGAH